MKKNVRKALAVSGMAIVIGASGLTLDTSANMMSEKRPSFEKQLRNSSGRKKTIMSEMMQRHRQTIFGTVTSVSDNSIEIQSRQKILTINVSDTTKILNKTWVAMPKSGIRVGDRLRVFGTLSNTTVTARTIRDISL